MLNIEIKTDAAKRATTQLTTALERLSAEVKRLAGALQTLRASLTSLSSGFMEAASGAGTYSSKISAMAAEARKAQNAVKKQAAASRDAAKAATQAAAATKAATAATAAQTKALVLRQSAYKSQVAGLLEVTKALQTTTTQTRALAVQGPKALVKFDAGLKAITESQKKLAVSQRKGFEVFRSWKDSLASASPYLTEADRALLSLGQNAERVFGPAFKKAASNYNELSESYRKGLEVARLRMAAMEGEKKLLLGLGEGYTKISQSYAKGLSIYADKVRSTMAATSSATKEASESYGRMAGSIGQTTSAYQRFMETYALGTKTQRSATEAAAKTTKSYKALFDTYRLGEPWFQRIGKHQEYMNKVLGSGTRALQKYRPALNQATSAHMALGKSYEKGALYARNFSGAQIMMNEGMGKFVEAANEAVGVGARWRKTTAEMIARQKEIAKQYSSMAAASKKSILEEEGLVARINDHIAVSKRHTRQLQDFADRTAEASARTKGFRGWINKLRDSFTFSNAKVFEGQKTLLGFTKQTDSFNNSAKRGTSILNTWIGRFSVYMSGVAATIFVLQNLVHVVEQFISVAADFERAIGKLEIKRATEQWADLTEQILKAADALGRRGTETAEALNLMIEAGFDLKESLSEIEGPIKQLATIMGIDLASAVDLVTGVLNAFNMDVSSTSEVVRSIGAIVMKTKISFKTLSEQLREVMPVAKQLGYSFDQVVTILGSLAQGNVIVKKTGDELRIAMIKAADFADKYSLANKNLVNVIDILKEKGLSASEVIKLFGEKQSEVISYIYEHISALKGLDKQIEVSGSEWEHMAAVMSKKVGPSWDKLKAAVANVLETWVSKYGPAMAKSMTEMAKWVVKNREAIVDFVVTMAKFAKIAGEVALLFLGKKGLTWLFNKFGAAIVDVNRTAAAMAITIGMGGRRGLIGSIGRLAVKMGVLRGAVLGLKLALSPLAKILLIMAAFDVGKWLYSQRQSWKSFVDDFTKMNDKVHELQDRMVTDQERLYKEFAGGKHREFIDSIEESTIKFSGMIEQLEKIVTLQKIKGPGYYLLHPSGLAGEVASKMNMNMREMNELLDAIKASFTGLGRAIDPAMKELEKFADPVMKMRLEDIAEALHKGLDLTKEQLTILFVASLRKDVEAMKGFSEEASNWMETVEKMLRATKGEKLDLITVEDRDKMEDILTGDALKMYEDFYKKVSYMSDKYYKHLRAKARLEYIHDAITREKIAEKGQEELIAAEMVYTQKVVKIEQDRTKSRVNWMKMTQRALPDIEKKILLEEAQGVNNVIKLYEDGYKEMGYAAEDYVDSLEKQLVTRYTVIFEKHLSGLQNKYKYYYKKFGSYPKKFYDDARDQLKAFAAKADEAFSGAGDKVIQYVKGLIKLLEQQDKINAEQTIYRNSLLKGAATIEKWKDSLEGAIKTLKQWKLWTARAKEEVRKQRLEIASFTAYMKSGGFVDGFVSGFLKISSEWDSVTSELVKTGYKTARDLYDGMKKFFFDAIKGKITSFKDVWKRMTDYMLDTFLSLLSKMMARAAMTKIVVPVMLSLGMGGNALAAALKSAGLGDFSTTFGKSMVSGMTSGQGASGILGLIGKVGSGIGQLITGSLSTSWAALQHTIAGFISPDWANAFSTGFASKIAGFIGTAPGWMMGIGSGIGAALVQGLSSGNWGGAAITGALTAIGGMIPGLGPIGAMIGGLVGSLVSKFFGSGHQDWKAIWDSAISSTAFFQQIKVPTPYLKGEVPSELVGKLQEGVTQVQKAWWQRFSAVVTALGEDATKEFSNVVKKFEVHFGGEGWVIRESHVEEDFNTILNNISDQMASALSNAIWGTGRGYTGTGWIDIPVPEEPLIDKIKDWFHEGIAFSKLDPAKLKELTDEFEAIDVGDVDALVTWFSKADEVVKSYDQITTAIDQMLGTENQFQIQFKALNTAFDNFVETLKDLGFQQSEIDRIEGDRIKAGKVLADTLMQEVDAVLDAHKYGTEFQKQIHTIVEWRNKYMTALEGAREEMEKAGLDVDELAGKVSTAFNEMLQDILDKLSGEGSVLQGILEQAGNLVAGAIGTETTGADPLQSIYDDIDTLFSGLEQSLKDAVAQGKIAMSTFRALASALATLKEQAKEAAKIDYGEAIRKQIMDPIDDIINKHTMTDFEYQSQKLIKWRDDQLEAIKNAKKDLEAAGINVEDMAEKVKQAFRYLMQDLVDETTEAQAGPSGFTTEDIYKKAMTYAGQVATPGSAIEEAKKQVDDFYADLISQVKAMRDASEISDAAAHYIKHWLEMMQEAAENKALEEIQNKIDDILFSAQDSSGALTEWDRQFKSITEKYDAWREQLIALGATTEELTRLEEARERELQNAADAIREEIDGIKNSARAAAGQISSERQQMDSLSKQFLDWENRLRELGATEAEVAEVESLRLIALQNYSNALVEEMEKTYDDIILKSALSDVDYQLYQITMWQIEQQNKLNTLLEEGVITTEQYAILMEKLNAATEAQIRDIQQQQAAEQIQAESDAAEQRMEEEQQKQEEREQKEQEHKDEMQRIQKAWESFRTSMITSTQLAPAVSAETVQAEYERLYAKAQAEKTEEAYNALTDYVQNTYLPFMRAYAGSQEQYAEIFERTMDQIEKLTNEIVSDRTWMKELYGGYWGEDSPIYKLWEDYMDRFRDGILFLAGRTDSYQSGTNLVPVTGMYQLHRGEAVIPASENPWNTATGTSSGPDATGAHGEVTVVVNLSVDGENISRTVARAGRNDREFKRLIGDIIKSGEVRYGG